MKIPRAWLAIGVVAAAAAVFGRAEEPRARALLVCEGITVYYDQKDEAFARKFCEKLPEISRDAQTYFRQARGESAGFSAKEFKARRDEYLSTIAYYLGLKRPTSHMKRTFDAALESVEKMTAATAADFDRHGIFDVVQIWWRDDLVAALRANGADDFFELDKDGEPKIREGITFSVNTHLSTVGKQAVRRRTSATTAPLLFGSPNRTRAFLPVILQGPEPVNVETVLPLQLTAARQYLASKVDTYMTVTQHVLLLMVLHEVVEVAVIDHLVASRDRRWFCEGMANFIAYRAVLELDSPEAARRGYDLRAQLEQWKKFENEVDLPAWKVNEDLADGEKGGDFNRARYAYATKAISNVYEKHGREFFPRWCREIARTPWKKANIATVHVAFERLTGEKLSDYYPRPLFQKP